MSLNNNKKKINSNRGFGFVFFTVFLIIAFWPLYKSNEIRIWSIYISLIFLILAITNSKILTPLNKMWNKFGLLLGAIISPLVMAAVFFIVVTPISLIMRILGKDILNIKNNNNKTTYWIQKSGPKSKMKNQF